MPSPASTVHTAKIELYRNRGKIHPRAISGRFNTLRWLLVVGGFAGTVGGPINPESVIPLDDDDLAGF